MNAQSSAATSAAAPGGLCVAEVGTQRNFRPMTWFERKCNRNSLMETNEWGDGGGLKSEGKDEWNQWGRLFYAIAFDTHPHPLLLLLSRRRMPNEERDSLRLTD